MAEDATLALASSQGQNAPVKILYRGYVIRDFLAQPAGCLNACRGDILEVIQEGGSGDETGWLYGQITKSSRAKILREAIVRDELSQPKDGYLNASGGDSIEVMIDTQDDDGWIYARLKNAGTNAGTKAWVICFTNGCTIDDFVGWLPKSNTDPVSATVDSSARVGTAHHLFVGSFITAAWVTDRPEYGYINVDENMVADQTPLKVLYIGSAATGDEDWIYVKTMGFGETKQGWFATSLVLRRISLVSARKACAIQRVRLRALDLDMGEKEENSLHRLPVPLVHSISKLA